MNFCSFGPSRVSACLHAPSEGVSLAGSQSIRFSQQQQSAVPKVWLMEAAWLAVSILIVVDTVHITLPRKGNEQDGSLVTCGMLQRSGLLLLLQ